MGGGEIILTQMERRKGKPYRHLFTKTVLRYFLKRNQFFKLDYIIVIKLRIITEKQPHHFCFL